MVAGVVAVTLAQCYTNHMSPDQQKISQLWIDGAKDALDTAHKLYVSQKYHHALFFCHLAVEKALKAIYIRQQDKRPPYLHELPLLASKTSHQLDNDQVIALDTINTFNIAARYQEEKQELYHRATPEYANHWISITEKIVRSLLP